jgi:hypothetical protein
MAAAISKMLNVRIRTHDQKAPAASVWLRRPFHTSVSSMANLELNCCIRYSGK